MSDGAVTLCIGGEVVGMGALGDWLAHSISVYLPP